MPLDSFVLSLSKDGLGPRLRGDVELCKGLS